MVLTLSIHYATWLLHARAQTTKKRKNTKLMSTWMELRNSDSPEFFGVGALSHFNKVRTAAVNYLSILPYLRGMVYRKLV